VSILIASLDKIAKEYKLDYSLPGGNLSMESILQKNKNMIYTADTRHLHAIHKQFGTCGINKLCFTSMKDQYITRKYFSGTKLIYPLNFVDYRLDKALEELKEFSGFTYYGGKHYESILTRFLQCWYLPVKYNFDKRKSHFSSMIISGQMTRDEALAKLAEDPYQSCELYEEDVEFLSNYLGMTREEFDDLMSMPPMRHSDYKTSKINKLAPIARKFRRLLG